MRTYKTKQVPNQVLDSKTCDKCGCKVEVSEYAEGGVTLQIHSQYGSAHDSMGPIEYDLCDKCAGEIIDTLGKSYE